MTQRAQQVLLIPALALRSVTSKMGTGVYASSDTLYKGAVFGRDSLEVAEDIMKIKPRLVRTIFLTLARLQGQTNNDTNEEEPGKIMHEYRAVRVDGKRITDTSMTIFKNLAARWGGNDTEMVYYGSIDATPHFLRALRSYCHIYGERFLHERVQQRNGQTVTMRHVAAASAEWLLRTVQASRSGLLEFQRRNPHGIANQVWKDSEEFYVHENKEFANHDAPIASIEVQGLAYDGFMAAAYFVPEQAEVYKAAANAIRDRTIELLWQEDRQSFALGLDYSPAGKMRIIRTPTANPAALLDTDFFHDLAPHDRQKYVTAIVEHIMGGDFLTDAGIRSRSLSAAHHIDTWDYHGSFVSWPKETYDIAKGLRRQGFHSLARQLENRILNIVLKNRQYPEFVYIDAKGRVLVSTPSVHTHGELILVEGSNKPERIQAWTVSAVLAIIYQRMTVTLKRTAPAQEPWQTDLEQRILTGIHKVKTYLNPFALSARYPTYQYRLTRQNQV